MSARHGVVGVVVVVVVVHALDIGPAYLNLNRAIAHGKRPTSVQRLVH